MAAYTSAAWNFIGGKGDPQRIEGTLVTPEFFRILDIRPVAGRIFSDEDARDGSPRTVILSYSFWQSVFGGRGDILGQTVRLDNETYSVIGVTPADFLFPTRGVQSWSSLVLGDPPKDARDNYYLKAMGETEAGGANRTGAG
jgi:hypothetical protein